MNTKNKNKNEKSGVRIFTTGATRSAEGDKYDYEGFLSPLALERFGAYMHKHRLQADGTLRDSDNWQKGIPIPQYLKSAWRHLVSTWIHFRKGWNTPAGLGPEIEDDLCAMIFNAQGMLHEILTAKGKARVLAPAPAPAKTKSVSRRPRVVGPIKSDYPRTYDEVLKQAGTRLHQRGYTVTEEFRKPRKGEWFASDPLLIPMLEDGVTGRHGSRWILQKVK